MTTVRVIVEAALSDLLSTAAGETPTAADAATGVRMLNQMIAAWPNRGVNTLAPTYTLASELVFFVPPRDIDGAAIDAITDQGTWDASTNTPALASSVGTMGDVYKVSVAGSTTLDDVSSWSVNDYLIFDGTEWMKGRSSAIHEETVIAMLAVRLSTPFSLPIPPELGATAQAGWVSLQAQYVKGPVVAVDDALRRMSSNRYINGDLL